MYALLILHKKMYILRVYFSNLPPQMDRYTICDFKNHFKRLDWFTWAYQMINQHVKVRNQVTSEIQRLEFILMKPKLESCFLFTNSAL